MYMIKYAIFSFLYLIVKSFPFQALCFPYTLFCILISLYIYFNFFAFHALYFQHFTIPCTIPPFQNLKLQVHCPAESLFIKNIHFGALKTHKRVPCLDIPRRHQRC